MGTTVDLMLMAPDETPEETIAPWDPPPGWRDPLVAAVAATAAWNRDDQNGWIYFWHPDIGWQVEFSAHGVVFRRRRGVAESALSDAEILRPFLGTPAVVHYDDETWWTLPDELPDDASMYG